MGAVPLGNDVEPMMSAPLIVTAVSTLVATVFYAWVWHVAKPPEVSGDGWYYRAYAFTDLPISPPYSWRPLFPLLARYLGFGPVSLAATMATPLVVYGYVGGGWVGTACALALVGNRVIFSFNVKNLDYSDGLGQFLFISCLWAMSVHHPAAWLLAPACMLTREALGVAVALIAAFTWPALAVPTVLAGALAYFGRRTEDMSNRHPLVEKTPYETLVRWTKVKLDGAVHYAQTVQPLRGSPLAVPFLWGDVSAFARWGLLAVAPIWFFSLPASGQSRHSSYCFGVFIPFIAAAGLEWAWLYAFLSWFWPVDFSTYDETGGQTFGYAR